MENVSKISELGTNVPAIASKTICSRNTSGHTGVYWDKAREKWQAEIMFQHKCYHLGRYADIDEAAKAYATAKKKTHGAFLEWYDSLDLKDKQKNKNEGD